jgi:hypothetical protein
MNTNLSTHDTGRVRLGGCAPSLPPTDMSRVRRTVR